MEKNTIDTANWMGQLSDSVKLNEIIMPGSHDAGMSELQHCDLGSQMNKGMVQTQGLNIGNQLNAGSRYFDIRVDYDHHELVTYHRSGDLGCNGQNLSVVINESIAFLQAQSSETFILKFSHIRPNRNMEREIKDRIDQFLSNMDFRSYFYTSSDRQVNIAELSLQDCRGKMILVFDYPEYISAREGHFRYHDGFKIDSSGAEVAAYSGPNITVCDSYANTTDLKKMEENQLTKLNNSGGLGKEYLFLLSRTLTPDVGTFFGGSIKELAEKANDALPAALSNQKDQGKPMPNIVYIDYVNVNTTREIIQYNFIN
jgi:1-phosphatidylinositol phosphodiesterase